MKKKLLIADRFIVIPTTATAKEKECNYSFSRFYPQMTQMKTDEK